MNIILTNEQGIKFFEKELRLIIIVNLIIILEQNKNIQLWLELQWWIFNNRKYLPANMGHFIFVGSMFSTNHGVNERAIAPCQFNICLVHAPTTGQ